MYLQYGPYRHALAECLLSISRRPKQSPSGTVIGYFERWDISGEVQAASSAALTAVIQSLETAYGFNGRDATLYLSDGVTPSAHRLISADSVNGVQVVQPVQFPNGTGGEYSTYRSYQLALEAEFATDDDTATSNLTSFQETISITGNGGPKHVIIECLNARPVRQITLAATMIRAQQSGTASASTFYPTPPGPLWPQWLLNDSVTITKVGPIGTQSNFTTNWSYSFESSSPLTGAPTRRIV